MQTSNSIENLNIDKPVVTIGSFDGVHRGHREVLRQLTDYARQTGGSSVVITFWPHPATVLGGGKQTGLLSTPDEKQQLMAETGIDWLITLPFTREFAQMEYDVFVTDCLVKKLHISTLLIGYDNKVGRNGRGRFAEVEALSKQFGFEVRQLEMLAANTQPISSTAIRNLLSEGRVIEANQLLGRPYGLSGKVVNGNHIGTTLGFPTANIQPDECKFVPGNGSYAIRANIDGTEYTGMLNIGNRPTIGDKGQPTIEAHLFNFSGNIYGHTVEVFFVDKIRNERQFANLDELRAQLETDCQTVKGWFGI
ncbi:MAG: bifunctional riboflavin kinase/FAD synthetase [Salinivirgaceae bacterium]|nr:bifunctional riboflavin kinase/FAD synthetase [Salinivirgaceae bacterium]